MAQPETSSVSTSNPNPDEVIAGIDKAISLKGLKLKTEWLVSCLAELEITIPEFSRLDVTEKAKHCLEKFLISDMNLCGAGVLPRNVGSMDSVGLAGPFVLQVDEILDITQSQQQRVLKLTMTEGVQRVVGIDCLHIEDLQALAPAGLKIVVSKVHVMNGVFLLAPESVEVLGGMVDKLEEERKCRVEEEKNSKRELRLEMLKKMPIAEMLEKRQKIHLPVFEEENNGGENNLDQQTSLSNMAVDWQSPYIPLANFAVLSREWAQIKDTMPHVPFLQKKIECCLNGFKKFEFKESEYEVVCYADDGQRTREILIHNDVVQFWIGCSSMEGRAALYSKSTTQKDLVKERVRRFQMFVSHFKGMILVEMNRSSQYPVAIKLNSY